MSAQKHNVALPLHADAARMALFNLGNFAFEITHPFGARLPALGRYDPAIFCHSFLNHLAAQQAFLHARSAVLT